MNDIIKKWNEGILSKGNHRITTNAYKDITDKKIKLIDLKYLEEMDNQDVPVQINRILASHLNSEDGNTCLYDFNKISKLECDKYSKCFLCKLDYLISVDRIRIIEGVHSYE